ncbi:hypothetical protein LXA43DRAFT_1176848 [Ganoderma leucocontextum]|nr:hypothetical protein LXA43DRAFT_1176848 [Ganoderma leucocontextum]
MSPRPSTYTLFFKLAFSLSATCPFLPGSAQLVNTTIDNTSGDLLTGATILYEPASLWRSGNQSLCVGCTAHPDPSRAYGETWHEGASLPAQSGGQSQVLTASMGFTVYVYCIIAPFWRTELAFYLDGERAGTFALAANTARVRYAGSGCAGDGNGTLALLDRVVYTHDSETRAGNTTSDPVASSTSILSGPSETPNSLSSSSHRAGRQ